MRPFEVTFWAKQVRLVWVVMVLTVFPSFLLHLLCCSHSRFSLVVEWVLCTLRQSRGFALRTFDSLTAAPIKSLALFGCFLSLFPACFSSPIDCALLVLVPHVMILFLFVFFPVVNLVVTNFLCFVFLCWCVRRNHSWSLLLFEVALFDQVRCSTVGGSVCESVQTSPGQKAICREAVCEAWCPCVCKLPDCHLTNGCILHIFVFG